MSRELNTSAVTLHCRYALPLEHHVHQTCVLDALRPNISGQEGISIHVLHNDGCGGHLLRHLLLH